MPNEVAMHTNNANELLSTGTMTNDVSKHKNNGRKP